MSFGKVGGHATMMPELTIESIHLCDLSTLVVSTQKSDLTWPPIKTNSNNCVQSRPETNIRTRNDYNFTKQTNIQIFIRLDA